MSIEGDQIEALTKEVVQLREELALLPDRIVERLTQEGIVSSRYKRELQGYRTVSEASRLKGVTTHAIRQAITHGNLPAIKQSRDWYIREDILDSYTPPGRGHPTRKK